MQHRSKLYNDRIRTLRNRTHSMLYFTSFVQLSLEIKCSSRSMRTIFLKSKPPLLFRCNSLLDIHLKRSAFKGLVVLCREELYMPVTVCRDNALNNRQSKVYKQTTKKSSPEKLCYFNSKCVKFCLLEVI